MRIGDMYVSTRNILNGLGSISSGELFVLIDMYGVPGEPELIYRFKHRDSKFVFSTFYVDKWFEPIGSNMKIKEEDMWDEEKATQQSYLSGQWIVGSINKRTGEVSFARKPKVHSSRGVALAEAKRLASTETNKEFMAVQIGAIASSVEVVVR